MTNQKHPLESVAEALEQAEYMLIEHCSGATASIEQMQEALTTLREYINAPEKLAVCQKCASDCTMIDGTKKFSSIAEAFSYINNKLNPEEKVEGLKEAIDDCDYNGFQLMADKRMDILLEAAKLQLKRQGE